MAGETSEADGERTAEPTDLGPGLRQRRAQIRKRIGELHVREQQLAERKDRGATSPESVEAARASAAQALEWSAERHVEAAGLHEQVADVLDEHGRPRRARAHREAAEANRQAAEVDAPQGRDD